MIPKTGQGVQIILSFALTAVLSLVCVTAAFFYHGIQSSQYALLDEIIASRFQALFKRHGVRRKIADDDALSPYQAFLLAMSDQALMTGIGSLIALYAQMCNGLSMFSFQVGVSLARLCAGIHFNTLTALRVYFRYNRKQAVARIVPMALFFIISIPSASLQIILSGCDPYRTAACGIRMLTEPDVQSSSLGWTTLSICLAYQSFRSMMYIRPRTAEEQVRREARRSPIISLMVWLPRNTKFRQDVELALRQRQADITGLKYKAANKIRNSATGRDALAHVLPYLLRDTFDSLVAEILTNCFWFALSVREVVDQLKVDVDLAPLLSWKYGQLMPMILMLAYILTAVEAVNDKKAESGSSHTPSLFDEPQSRATVAQLPNISLTESRRGGNDSQATERIHAPSRSLPPSVPEGNQATTTGSRPLASSPVENPLSALSPEPKFDCAGTAVRRVNSLQVPSTDHAHDLDALRKTISVPAAQAPTAPVRHDTVSLEAQDKNGNQRPGDLDALGVAYARYKAIVQRWAVFILVLMMCWQVVLFRFFEIAFLVMAGIWFLKHALRTGRFLRALHQVRRARSDA